MLKKVLWLALACAVLLATLFLSRQVRFTGDPDQPKTAPAVEQAAQPAAAKEPAPKAVEAPPQPTPEELQIQDDAAAVGMTTMEPEAEAPPTPDSPAEPPT